MSNSFFKAKDINGREYIIREMGDDLARVERGGMFPLWAYKVYTSTYIATDGTIYSRMPDKLKEYDTEANREYALRQLAIRGYLK